MFQTLEIFRMADALAIHSGARQAEIAANVANADTPGYRAGDLTPFSEVYETGEGGNGLRVSRSGHFGDGLADHAEITRVITGDSASPNGNTVSLEAEMVRAVEVRHAHETALAVYESARNILRTSLGRAR